MTFDWLKNFGKWLLSVYSESDGSGSSTRVHMAAVITFVLGVGVSFAVMVHHKSMTIDQFNSFLAAGTTFIGVNCGVLYGINKTSSAVELSISKPNDKQGQ